MTQRFKSFADGSIEVSESWRFLRVTCAVAAPLVIAVILFEEWTDGSVRIGRLAGAALGAIGLLLIAAVVDDREFLFDAQRRELRWCRRNWFRRLADEVPFGQIRSATVVRSTSRDEDSNRPRRSFTAFVNTEQDALQLPGGESADRVALDELVGAIQRLIATEETTRPDDTVLQWVRAGRLIDAVRHLREQEGLSLADAERRVHELQRALRSRELPGHRLGQ